LFEAGKAMHHKLHVMNYLAHAYLSFRNPAWITGNLVSDFVKGKRRFDFPADIQHGISLHRAIDTYTDAHPLHKEARDIFRPAYRLYSGAFIDVVFDHFLATDNTCFPKEEDLFAFSQYSYNSVEQYYALLPSPFQQAFQSMRLHNWLYNYRHIDGIARSFQGLVYRSTYLEESHSAVRILEEHYESLKTLYQPFFADLQAHIKPFDPKAIL
jgi:acyl carrier protein phosphodiesterase